MSAACWRRGTTRVRAYGWFAFRGCCLRDSDHECKAGFTTEQTCLRSPLSQLHRFPGMGFLNGLQVPGGPEVGLPIASPPTLVHLSLWIHSPGYIRPCVKFQPRGFANSRVSARRYEAQLTFSWRVVFLNKQTAAVIKPRCVAISRCGGWVYRSPSYAGGWRVSARAREWWC